MGIILDPELPSFKGGSIYKFDNSENDIAPQVQIILGWFEDRWVGHDSYKAAEKYIGDHSEWRKAIKESKAKYQPLVDSIPCLISDNFHLLPKELLLKLTLIKDIRHIFNILGELGINLSLEKTCDDDPIDNLYSIFDHLDHVEGIAPFFKYPTNNIITWNSILFVALIDAHKQEPSNLLIYASLVEVKQNLESAFKYFEDDEDDMKKKVLSERGREGGLKTAEKWQPAKAKAFNLAIDKWNKEIAQGRPLTLMGRMADTVSNQLINKQSGEPYSMLTIKKWFKAANKDDTHWFNLPVEASGTTQTKRTPPVLLPTHTSGGINSHR